MRQGWVRESKRGVQMIAEELEERHARRFGINNEKSEWHWRGEAKSPKTKQDS